MNQTQQIITAELILRYQILLFQNQVLLTASFKSLRTIYLNLTAKNMKVIHHKILMWHPIYFL